MYFGEKVECVWYERRMVPVDLLQVSNFPESEGESLLVVLDSNKIEAQIVQDCHVEQLQTAQIYSWS